MERDHLPIASAGKETSIIWERLTSLSREEMRCVDCVVAPDSKDLLLKCTLVLLNRVGSLRYQLEGVDTSPSRKDYLRRGTGCKFAQSYSER